jgi:hypothetical protein
MNDPFFIPIISVFPMMDHAFFCTLDSQNPKRTEAGKSDEYQENLIPSINANAIH